MIQSDIYNYAVIYLHIIMCIQLCVYNCIIAPVTYINIINKCKEGRWEYVYLEYQDDTIW